MVSSATGIFRTASYEYSQYRAELESSDWQGNISPGETIVILSTIPDEVHRRSIHIIVSRLGLGIIFGFSDDEEMVEL